MIVPARTPARAHVAHANMICVASADSAISSSRLVAVSVRERQLRRIAGHQRRAREVVEQLELQRTHEVLVLDDLVEILAVPAAGAPPDERVDAFDGRRGPDRRHPLTVREVDDRFERGDVDDPRVTALVGHEVAAPPTQQHVAHEAIGKRHVDARRAPHRTRPAARRGRRGILRSVTRRHRILAFVGGRAWKFTIPGGAAQTSGIAFTTGIATVSSPPLSVSTREKVHCTVGFPVISIE